MRRLLFLLFTTLCFTSLEAQTMNVRTGQVVYRMLASQTGEMLFDNGVSLTVIDKVFSISEIDEIVFDDSQVVAHAVQVHYEGESATVYVAGDIARDITVSVSGAHVSIEQGDDVEQEITYTLSGTSADGEFILYGSYKATVELDGLTLTNPSGAAIDIQNGKRIELSVKKDTENTLTDGANGSQKACLYCKGHLELKGKGTLNVYGNTAHAIKSAEYMTIKNCTVNVLKAVKDGLSCDEYFLMESGTLTISGTGDDAIQCDIDGTTGTGTTSDHEDEDSGNIYIEGGTLTLTTTAAGAKGLKSDSTVVVNGGTLTIDASGAIDTSDASDPSFVTGIKAGKFVQNRGVINMTIKGVAGRGVKAYDIETNGGELTISNSGTPQTVSGDVKSAKGLMGLNVALNAGTITITMTGNAGKGIKAGDGTSSGSSGGWGGPGGGPGGPGGGPGGGGPGGGGPGGGTTWTNVTGSYSQGREGGSGPTLTVKTTGSTYSSSSAKAIKAICEAHIYGGTTEVSTTKSGAEGLESKSGIYIEGGNHYFQCYDDCLNSAGAIYFNGGVTVCHSNGNDAVDSNYGRTGAVTIGNGTVFAYTTKGAPEEGIDCDNNSYIQITGTGIAISAGASQGGGGWGGSSGNTISNASQGYAFVTNSISYVSGRYYTLADASGNNLVTYSFPVSCNSSLSLFTAKGMVKNATYNVKYATSAPTDATTAWHGLYLGSTAKGTTSVTSFTAK